MTWGVTKGPLPPPGAAPVQLQCLLSLCITCTRSIPVGLQHPSPAVERVRLEGAVSRKQLCWCCLTSPRAQHHTKGSGKAHPTLQFAARIPRLQEGPGGAAQRDITGNPSGAVAALGQEPGAGTTLHPLPPAASLRLKPDLRAVNASWGEAMLRNAEEPVGQNV